MIENGSGTIVELAPLASSLKGFFCCAAYASSKAVVIGPTKSVAVDSLAKGVRWDAICLGTPARHRSRPASRRWRRPAAATTRRLNTPSAGRPMGRLGTAKGTHEENWAAEEEAQG